MDTKCMNCFDLQHLKLKLAERCETVPLPSDMVKYGPDSTINRINFSVKFPFVEMICSFSALNF